VDQSAKNAEACVAVAAAVAVFRAQLARHPRRPPIYNVRRRIKENEDKIKLNRTLPYLVANVVELVELSAEEKAEAEAESAQADALSLGAGDVGEVPSAQSGKAVVIKTTQRQTVYLPVAGLVDTSELKPGDLIGTNKVRARAGELCRGAGPAAVRRGRLSLCRPFFVPGFPPVPSPAGLLPHPRKAAHRVRPARQGHGAGRKADGRLLGRGRLRQADPGAD